MSETILVEGLTNAGARAMVATSLGQAYPPSDHLAFLGADHHSTAVDPDFAHTQRFVLIDKNFHVRGFYNGLDSVSLGQLSKDIGLLMLENTSNSSSQK